MVFCQSTNSLDTVFSVFVENYVLENLKLMISSELIKIKLYKICPKDSATRAEVVYALYNILKTNMKK